MKEKIMLMVLFWLNLKAFRFNQNKTDHSGIKNKVKCALVQALRLCAGCTVRRGSRGIALPFHDHGTRRGLGVSIKFRPLFTPRKDPVPIVPFRDAAVVYTIITSKVYCFKCLFNHFVWYLELCWVTGDLFSNCYTSLHFLSYFMNTVL